MPRTHSPHRVVIRNEKDKIISDIEHDTFAIARPAYDETTGYAVTLQHGARVIFRKGPAFE